MTIGEKIKKLRTDKLMSQSELAGSEITRNMLSQIEHGSALPSLSTVRYIAARLNVSPGFLLAEDEDEMLYLKQAEINNIKKAFAAKNFYLCRDMCENCTWSDDELMLISAECSLAVGAEEFSRGNLHASAEILDEALRYCESTIYSTDVILFKARAYFLYMGLISPMLTSNVIDDLKKEDIIMFTDGFSVYCDMICEAEEHGWDEVSHLSERMRLLPEESSFFLHVNARILMDHGEYAEAHKILYKLLCGEDYGMPEPMLYFVFCDLEICCKEIDDFKGAYEYSGNKMALLQKLLA